VSRLGVHDGSPLYKAVTLSRDCIPASSSAVLLTVGNMAVTVCARYSLSIGVKGDSGDLSDSG
jgi:hypothetical protein